MANLKNIAEITGFSVATVSRVLNNDQTFNVSEKTRKKVLAVAEKLGYKTLSQRQLSTSKMVIGLAYWYSSADEMIDSHYLAIRTAIKEYCDKLDVILKIFYLNEVSYDDIKNAALDGLIALGKFSEVEIDDLSQLHEHFVLVDCPTKKQNIDVVFVDLIEATNSVIEYLLEKGLTSIGFIGAIESTIDGKSIKDDRLEAFINHKEMDNDAVYLGRLNLESGYEIMTNIIKNSNLKKAYIVATDTVAIGCLRALYENNIKVPQDISIISFNNIYLSQYLAPALSTVDLNAEHLGFIAAEVMIERIKNNRQLARKTFIPTKLIIRESSI